MTIELIKKKGEVFYKWNISKKLTNMLNEKDPIFETCRENYNKFFLYLSHDPDVKKLFRINGNSWGENEFYAHIYVPTPKLTPEVINNAKKYFNKGIKEINGITLPMENLCNSYVVLNFNHK